MAHTPNSDGAVVNVTSTVEQCLGLVQVQVFHRKAQSVASAAERLGLRALPQSGQTLDTRYGVCFSTSPGRWTFLTEAGSEEELANDLDRHLEDEVSFVNVVSDRLLVTRLSGDGVRELLSRGTTVDVHSSRFTGEMCIGTRFAGIHVQLVNQPATDTVLMIVDRTYEDYVRRWVVSALGAHERV